MNTLSIYSMDRNVFNQLKQNMRSSLDSYKIDMLNELSSETYTCQQVQEILNLFSLASYRIDAFKILATKLEDSKNKGIIMSAFQNDLASYKKDAYRIYNTIKVQSPKKEVEREKPRRKKRKRLTGTIRILKSKSRCKFGHGIYSLSDMVQPAVRFNKKVGATSYSLWISYCTSNHHDSCTTPFSKKTGDILPDWNVLRYSSPISVYNLLTNNRSVRLPRYNVYNISIIVKNRLAAETMIRIKRACR